MGGLDGGGVVLVEVVRFDGVLLRFRLWEQVRQFLHAFALRERARMLRRRLSPGVTPRWPSVRLVHGLQLQSRR